MSDALLQDILDEYDDADAPDGFAAEVERFAADIAVAEDAGIDVTAATALREPFALTTPEAFDWAARKLAKAQHEVARLEEWKQSEAWKLAQAFDRRIKIAQHDVDHLDGMIRFAVEALEPDAKGKQSIKTPHLTATVVRREHFEWPADDELVAWAESYTAEPGLLHTKVTPDKTAIKKYVKATGDAPDGLEVTTVASVRIEASL